MKMKKKKIDIVLASSSPRRKEILTSIGMDFRIVTSDTDETLEGVMIPDAAVCEIAKRKCEDVKEKLINENNLTDQTLIIACDTVVVYEGMLIGKPLDEAHAILTLGILSDSWHSVYSGLAVYYKGKTVCRAARTDVKFRELSEAEIKAYAESGEPMGKAGSYAIQMKGASFVERIEGEFNNVVGLPVSTLLALLRNEFSLDSMDILHYNQ
ncbi:MAG: septum formation protein Maf [Clostridia bacterium]|nr:septum formation protein Maf [Clostridia bacterium]